MQPKDHDPRQLGRRQPQAPAQGEGQRPPDESATLRIFDGVTMRSLRGILAINAIVTALLIAAAVRMDGQEVATYRKDFRDHIAKSLNVVRYRTELYLNESLFPVEGLSALVTINPRVNQGDFNRFAESVVRSHRGIINVGLAPDGVYKYVYPLKGNERVLGLNVLTQRSAMEQAYRALRENTLVIDGPFQLIQGNIGIVGRKPISVRMVQEGNESDELWGLLGIVFDFNTLVEELGWREQDDTLQYAVRGRNGLGAQGEVFFGSPKVFDRDPVIVDIQHAGSVGDPGRHHPDAGLPGGDA